MIRDKSCDNRYFVTTYSSTVVSKTNRRVISVWRIIAYNIGFQCNLDMLLTHWATHGYSSVYDISVQYKVWTHVISKYIQ